MIVVFWFHSAETALDVSLTVTNEEYSDELADEESDEFEALRDSIVPVVGLDHLFSIAI